MGFLTCLDHTMCLLCCAMLCTSACTHGGLWDRLRFECSGSRLGEDVSIQCRDELTGSREVGRGRATKLLVTMGCLVTARQADGESVTDSNANRIASRVSRGKRATGPVAAGRTHHFTITMPR